MHNLVHCYAQRRPISLHLADFGKRFPSTVFRSLSILLVLLIFSGFGDGVRGQSLTVNPTPSSGSSSSSAGGGSCGVFSKPIGIPENYSGDLYYDRFGNIWTETEITDLSANVVEECTAGVFKLSFSGNYTSDEKTTVCEVFTYLSGQVGGNNPVNGVVPIKIEFEGLAGGIGGEASLFYVLDCGILKNMPLANIRTKSNLLPLGFYAALIKINEGVNWYTGATVPNISNWNSDPAYLGKTDLYTAVLHEALHTLGFASTYGGVKTSDGTILPDVYTEYDKHLYQKTGNTIPLSQLPNYKKLIIPANDPACCSKYKKNEGAPTDFNDGCEDQIFFGEPYFSSNVFTEFAEVSNISSNPDPGNIDEINNKLSHLDIDCNGGNLPFVMHPGLPASPATHSYPRRAITSPERDILNRIGYVTSSCAIQLGDDVIPATLFLNGGSNTFEASLSSLSANDFSNGNPLAYFELITPLPVGLEITPVLSGPNTTSIIIKALQVGIWTFKYRYNYPQGHQCHNASCDEATVTVSVLERPVFLDCQTEECNLTCYGDAEKFDSEISSKYIKDLGLPQPLYLFSISQNTPDILTQVNANDNQVFSFFSGNASISPPQINFESLLLPLSKPINPGCTATVRFKSTSGTINFIPPNSPKLVFLGLTNYNDCHTIEYPDCNNATGTISCPNSPNPQDKSFCLGSKNISFDEDALFDEISISVDNLNLQQEEFIFTNTFNAPIKHLIVHGSFDGYDPTVPNLGYQVSFFMDDIEVTQNCVNNLQITPTVLAECIGEQATIQYEVCLTGQGTLPQTITLDVNPPIGLTIVPNADFNSDGTASFQLTPGPNCNGGPNVKVITLEMQVSPNFDPAQAPFAINLPLSVNADGFCTDLTTGFGGNTTLMLQNCTPEPITCECVGDPIPPIGINSGSTTSLTDLNLASELTNKCIKINGTLNVDKDWKLINCSVIMGNGASIVVTNNKKLEITLRTVLQGCEKMWKGITVNSGAQFIADGKSGQVSILDAQYAVQPKSGSTISIAFTRFDKNYLGIYTAPNGSTQSVTTTALSGNEFLCTGNLLPNYVGQTPATGTVSYAMAELNQTIGIDFMSNTADGLTNGLIADRSTFRMEKCTIINLVNALSYPIRNTGVHATQCASAFLGNNVFKRNGTSIFATKTNIEAISNTIENTTTAISDYFYGIVVKDATGKLTKIQENKITTWGPGVMISDALAPLRLDVRLNIIKKTMTVQGTPSDPLASIDLDRCEKGLIFYNKMYNETNSSSGEGIKMNECSNNNIAYNEAYSFRNGYQVDGGATNYFYSNSAQSQQGKNRIGFEVWNSVNSFCLNTTNNQAQEGWLFSGACTPSHLNCNTIGNAQYGLYLTALGTEIGQQNNKGNQWTGSYEEWGAYHASTDENLIGLSRFRMPAAQIPTWETAAGSATWFENSNGSTNCTAICPQPVDTEFNGGGAAFGDSDTDIRTAMGDHADAGMNWMGQQRLFERLKSDASGTGIVQTFYNNAESTAMGQLSQLRHKAHAVLTHNATQQQPVLAVQTQIKVLSDELATLRNNGPINVSETAWRHQMGIKQGALRQKMAQWYGYENGLKAAYNSQLPALLSENAAITTFNTFADNEKTLNTLRLTHQYLTGSTPADPVVLERVKSIADQCPMEGGFAVYEARTAYRNYFPQQTWDDRTLCQVELRSTPPRSSSANPSYWVQPNPANQSVGFYAGQLPETPTKVNLYAFTGALVATQVFTSNTLTIDTQQLPAGMYYYMIHNESGTLQSGKLIIAH